MEKTDPDDDVFLFTDPMADKPESTDDLEILSASVDWSGDVVVCEFTVKGEVVNVSADGTENTYYYNLDITKDTNEEEIWFTYTFSGFTGGSEFGLIDFCDEEFTSVNGIFRFDFDKSHFGENPDVLNIEVRAMNENGWIDEIRWEEGLPGDGDDDTSGDDTSDDDKTDDDTSDDDTSDDDTSDPDEDKEDSPGFPLFLIVISTAIGLISLGRKRRRNKMS